MGINITLYNTHSEIRRTVFLAMFQGRAWLLVAGAAGRACRSTGNEIAISRNKTSGSQGGGKGPVGSFALFKHHRNSRRIGLICHYLPQVVVPT